MENKLEQFVEILINNQNYNCDQNQKNLHSTQDYYSLLEPVLKLFNKKLTLEEIREKLFKESGIKDGIFNLVYKKELVPGIVISYGTNNYRETIVVGNKQEILLNNNKVVPAISKMKVTSIFDIASITKLFTCLVVMKLFKEGKISLKHPISKYDKRFMYIQDVTIEELLCFIPLVFTHKDKSGKLLNFHHTDDPLLMEQILFNVSKDDSFIQGVNKRYNDLSSMILRYIIEGVTGNSLYKNIIKYIIKPTKMSNTFIKVPKSRIKDVVTINYEYKFFKNNSLFIKDSHLGIVNDRKARIMCQNHSLLCGHAGLFSTIDDLAKLSSSILEDKKQTIITKDKDGLK